MQSLARSDSRRDRISRSRPVSCYFCRSRKLRCSRQFPCSNCTTRGINCQLHTSQLSRSAAELGKEQKTDKAHSEILSRLRRLEDAVLITNGHLQAQTNVTAELFPADLQNRHHDKGQSTGSDAEQLERECINRPWLDSIHPDEPIFRKCPIQQITKPTSYVYPDAIGPSCSGEPTKCVWLPLHSESEALLNRYLTDITYLHHVVHTPSARRLVDDVYATIDRQSDSKPGHIALLLSILASATYSWTSRDTVAMFSNPGKANDQSVSWIKATLDVLDYSRRRTSGSVEDIQAMVILSFVVCSLEGPSRRYRELISMATTLARELNLHRIDDHSYSSRQVISLCGPVRKEVGRRVWWYIVSTDWMSSRYASPQEGTYSISPQHMAVDKPRNVNDEDLTDAMSDIDMPLSKPTSVSYLLQRIRLAENCRELSDCCPLSLPKHREMNLSQVMEIDARFDNFVQQIPAFFNLDEGRLSDPTDIHTQRSPGIVTQKYILNSLVYAQRCKLHMHYLERRNRDAAHTRSREICLSAARTIIRAERLLEMENIPFVLTRLKSAGILYCIFMAVIVLLLDVCLNKGDANEEERKMEVVDAFSILEEAREQSNIATMLLDSLMKVVRKHQVHLPKPKTSQKIRLQHGIEDSRPCMLNVAGDFNSDPGLHDADGHAAADLSLSCLDEIWQTFDGDMDVDAFLSALDTPFS